MDAIKICREIGFFMTAKNIAAVMESEELINKVGEVMPLPEAGMEEKIQNVTDWLTEFKKTKYMFLSPEIALIESFKETAGDSEAIIMVPSDMDEEMSQRLGNNLPRNMKVSLLREPYYPEQFIPGNGMIVVCGYMAGSRLMVLQETYRMIHNYCDFPGKIVFLPYTQIDTSVWYGDWLEVKSDLFSEIWRGEHD